MKLTLETLIEASKNSDKEKSLMLSALHDIKNYALNVNCIIQLCKRKEYNFSESNISDILEEISKIEKDSSTILNYYNKYKS